MVYLLTVLELSPGWPWSFPAPVLATSAQHHFVRSPRTPKLIAHS